MGPAEQIVAAASAVLTATDGQGRVLEVRRPGALDRLRLFKAVGPVLAENERYLGYAMLAMAVSSIDGVPVPAPVNEGQLEGLVARLGDAGLVAVSESLEAADANPGN